MAPIIAAHPEQRTHQATPQTQASPLSPYISETLMLAADKAARNERQPDFVQERPVVPRQGRLACQRKCPRFYAGIRAPTGEEERKRLEADESQNNPQPPAA